MSLKPREKSSSQMSRRGARHLRRRTARSERDGIKKLTQMAAEEVPRSVVWTFVIFAVVTAYLVRSWFPHAWNEASRVSSIFYEGDTRQFMLHAAQLEEGASVNNGLPFRPPGWPWLLSIFFRVMGYSPLSGQPVDPAAVKSFVAGISALSVGCITFLTWRLAGFGAMLVVVLFGTFHFGHVVQGTVPNSEALYGLLLVLVLLLASYWIPDSEILSRSVSHGRTDRSSSSRRAFFLGCVAGAATLVRAEFGLCVVLLVPFLWWSTGSKRQSLLSLGAYALGVIFFLTPSTIVHWQSISKFNAKFADALPEPLSRFVPVTSYGGFNFAHAFHSYTDGTTNLDLLIRAPKSDLEEALVANGKLDITQPVSYDLYVNGYRIGAKWILSHPVEALILLGKKLQITSGALALGYFQDNRVAGVAGLRRRVDQLDPTVRWLWPFHFSLAVLGIWILRRQRRTLWLLAMPMLTLMVALTFFGYVRLGVVYMPVLWVLQGAALASVFRWLPWPLGFRIHVKLIVVSIVLILLLTEMLGIKGVRQLYIQGPQGPDGFPIRDAAIQLLTTRPSGR